MDPVAAYSADLHQPESGVRGLDETAVAREPDHAPRRRGPRLDEPELVDAIGPRRVRVLHGIDAVVCVGRPVAVEVVEGVMSAGVSAPLEIAVREAEGVVDPETE
jgi:hypothetical protein